MARLLAVIAVASTAALAVLAGPAAAADADSGSDAMKLEIIGVELTPLSFNVGSPRPGLPPPDRFQLGAGGALRLAKLRWPTIYWTLAQAGLFFGGEEATVFMHVETEAGVTLRSGTHAFELGLGVGIGLLVVPYERCNDTTCSLGGGGLIVSPVVRYVLRQTAPYAVALVARAEVIAVNTPSACGDRCTGRATLFLVGVDIGFGFAPTPPPPPLLHAD